MSESTTVPDQGSLVESFAKRITALENENRALLEEAETLKIEREEARAKALRVAYIKQEVPPRGGEAEEGERAIAEDAAFFSQLLWR